MITQMEAPCWYAKYPGGEEHQNQVHYHTRAGAEQVAKNVHEEDPERTAEVGQWPGRCWEARCDGDCGEQYADDEYDGGIHFSSRTQAEQGLRDSGWRVLADGRDFCFDDVPEDCGPEVVPVHPDQAALWDGN